MEVWGGGTVRSPWTPRLGFGSVAGGVTLSLAWGRTSKIKTYSWITYCGDRGLPAGGLPCSPQIGTSLLHCYNLFQSIALPLHLLVYDLAQATWLPSG